MAFLRGHDRFGPSWSFSPPSFIPFAPSSPKSFLLVGGKPGILGTNVLSGGKGGSAEKNAQGFLRDGRRVSALLPPNPRGRDPSSDNGALRYWGWASFKTPKSGYDPRAHLTPPRGKNPPGVGGPGPRGKGVPRGKKAGPPQRAPGPRGPAGSQNPVIKLGAPCPKCPGVMRRPPPGGGVPGTGKKGVVFGGNPLQKHALGNGSFNQLGAS